MKRRMVPLIALVVWGLLITAGLGTAALRTTQLSANLRAVPKQQVKTPNASGHFSGTLVVRTKTNSTLRWRLTYAGMSSAVTYADIVLPAIGTQGKVSLQLCNGLSCKAPVVRISRMPALVAKALASRKGYVEIRTKKNPRGEIRGLIVRSG